MDVKNSLFNQKKKVLKKAGMWWKPNILLSAKTVFVIGLIATVIDGVTIYMSLDPILKGMLIFTLLLSCVGAAVLDLFPIYWPIAIERMREKNNSDIVVKIFFACTVITWGLVMLALCVFRFSAWEFILMEALQENSIALQESGDLYQPELSKTIGIIIMMFFNALNLATSAAVLLSSILSTKSQKEDMANKKLTLKTELEYLAAEKQQEIDQLNNVVNADYSQLDADRLDALKRLADSEAVENKIIAREVLEEELSDSDVDVLITKSSHDVVDNK